MEISYVKATPLNRLFFAINHYVSTGDHVGEGIAFDGPGGKRTFAIPVRPRELEDAEGLHRLAARIDQLRHEGRIDAQVSEIGREGDFVFYGIDLFPDDVEPLAAMLREAPGPLGWGAIKSFIDAREWREA